MSSESHPSYDPVAAARALGRLRRQGPGRKLSFYDQCAAFYALYNGASPTLVAKAFGISLTAASQLGGCLEVDPRPYSIELRVDSSGVHEERILRDMNRNRMPDRKRRYRRVAETFLAMGEEAFAAKYYPEHISLRILNVKHGLDEGRPRASGPDPAPDGDPSWITLPDGHRINFGWRDEPNPPGPAGWYIFGEHVDMGAKTMEGGDQWPFATQAAVRAAICKMYDLPLPTSNRKPG